MVLNPPTSRPKDKDHIILISIVSRQPKGGDDSIAVALNEKDSERNIRNKLYLMRKDWLLVLR